MVTSSYIIYQSDPDNLASDTPHQNISAPTGLELLASEATTNLIRCEKIIVFMAKGNYNLQDLIRRINSQVGWVRYDSLSFLWLKNGRFKGSVPTIFGGGNLMMANSAFSALNYLSKINYILRTPSEKFTDTTPFINSIGQQESNRHYNSLYNQVKKYLFSKSEWQVNELEAFGNLISDLVDFGIDLGLKPNDAKSEWINYRNYLSHMNYPEGFINSHNNIVSEEIILRGHEAVYDKLLELKEHSFFKFFSASGSGEYRYGFNVEIFIFRDLPKICEYITGKMEEADGFHLTKLAEWESHPTASIHNHRKR